MSVNSRKTKKVTFSGENAFIIPKEFKKLLVDFIMEYDLTARHRNINPVIFGREFFRQEMLRQECIARRKTPAPITFTDETARSNSMLASDSDSDSDEELKKILTKYSSIMEKGTNVASQVFPIDSRSTMSNKSPMEMPIHSVSRSRRAGVSSEAYDPATDKSQEKKQRFPKSVPQEALLMEAVKKTFVLRILDKDIVGTIVEAMQPLAVKKGSYIMKGEYNADAFFVVLSGSFVEIPPPGGASTETVYKMGDTIGQLALSYHQANPCTVRALENGKVWYIKRNLFRRFVVRHTFLKMKKFEGFCDSVPLLRDLDADTKMNLYDAFEERQYIGRSNIYQVGDKPDGMYFLREGCVKEHNIAKSEDSINVRYFKKGDYFGELETITRKPRSRIATTIHNVNAAFLPAEHFNRLLGRKRHILKMEAKEYDEKIENEHGVIDAYYDSSKFHNFGPLTSKKMYEDPEEFLPSDIRKSIRKWNVTESRNQIDIKGSPMDVTGQNEVAKATSPVEEGRNDVKSPESPPENVTSPVEEQKSPNNVKSPPADQKNPEDSNIDLLRSKMDVTASRWDVRQDEMKMRKAELLRLRDELKHKGAEDPKEEKAEGDK